MTKGSEIEYNQRFASATIGVISLAISTSDLTTEEIIEISKSLEKNLTSELSLNEDSKIIIFGFNVTEVLQVHQ